MASITSAQQLYQQGRHRQAAASCRRILARSPRHRDALNLLGIIECQSGNFDTGLEHLRLIIEIDPGSIIGQCNLGQALALAGQTDEAERVYGRVLDAEPANGRARGALALLLHRHGRSIEAERLCREGLETNSRDPAVLFSLGSILGMNERHDEAIPCLRRVLELEPGNPAAATNLANALQENGDLEAALRLYQQVLSADPSHLDALVNVGHLFREQGDTDTALRSYRTALKVEPRCADAHYYAGVILQRRAEQTAAIDHFRSAITVQPDMERAHWGLQQSFLLAGRPDHAREACDRCLAVLPDNQMTVANQAFACLLAGDVDGFDYLYDLRFFPCQARIPVPAGFETVAQLNGILTRDIMAHPSLRWQHDDYETSDRAFAYGLQETPSDALQAFTRALRDALDAFIARIEPEPRHPFFGRIPRRYELNMWATVIQTGGWHRAHNHEKAWLSGVYYVSCPPSPGDAQGQAGWIEFDGFTHYCRHGDHEHRVRRLAPAPGVSLFFPSYMLHATRPFVGDDYRISIAFDVSASA